MPNRLVKPIIIEETDLDTFKNLESNNNQSVFMHPLWLQSFKTKNKVAVYLLIKSNDTIIGKLAGVSVRTNPLIGKELYFYTAPTYINNNRLEEDKFAQSLIKFARSKGYNRLMMSSYDNWAGNEIKATGAYPSLREEYVLDLTTDNPHARHHKKFINNYKRGLRVNADIVENSNKEGLSNLMRLLGSTQKIRLEKKGDDYDFLYMPYINEEYILNLLNSGLAKIHEVRHDGTVIAASMDIVSKDSVYGLFMAFDEFSYKNGISAFFAYRMIDIYSQSGIARYNFGGVPQGKVHQGIRAYKESIGAHSVMQHGFTTNFLQFPYTIFNPLLNIARRIKKSNKD